MTVEDAKKIIKEREREREKEECEKERETDRRTDSWITRVRATCCIR